MTRSNLQIGFFLIVTTIASVLTLWLFIPFLSPILLGAVLAVVFYPVHKRILSKMLTLPSIASGISTLLILIVVLIPLTMIGWMLVEESVGIYQRVIVSDSESNVFVTSLYAVEDVVEQVTPLKDFHISAYIDPEQYVLASLGWIQENVGGVFTRVVDYSLSVLILIFAIFVFLRDGNKFIERLVTLSPLNENFDRQIVHKMYIAFNSVIVGEIVIAVVQGLLAGVGFWFFGIPNALIWAVITAVAALVPVIGTGVIFFPLILFSFLTMGWVPTIGLLAWWVLVVSIVDNIIRPLIIERGMHINPFLILISVLGGLHAFGPIGFIAGPLILGFFFALLDIYPLLIQRLADDK